MRPFPQLSELNRPGASEGSARAGGPTEDQSGTCPARLGSPYSGFPGPPLYPHRKIANARPCPPIGASHLLDSPVLPVIREVPTQRGISGHLVRYGRFPQISPDQ